MLEKLFSGEIDVTRDRLYCLLKNGEVRPVLTPENIRLVSNDLKFERKLY